MTFRLSTLARPRALLQVTWAGHLACSHGGLRKVQFVVVLLCPGTNIAYSNHIHVVLEANIYNVYHFRGAERLLWSSAPCGRRRTSILFSVYEALFMQPLVC